MLLEQTRENIINVLSKLLNDKSLDSNTVDQYRMFVFLYLLKETKASYNYPVNSCYSICQICHNKLQDILIKKFQIVSKISELSSIIDLPHLSKLIFGNWPKFSGNGLYPINFDQDNNPEKEFYNSHNKWVGGYGSLRKELLNWSIEYLEGFL
ncbi:hypothetical protein TH1_141 [Shewanella phage Thanatos-1]|nr:hypothetical protein TH1_141 [Shewanella phage Thanatos-1]